MQLSPRHLVRRRFSNTATALVIVSLLLGSVGAMSVLRADRAGAPPQPGTYVFETTGPHGLR